MKRPDYEVFRRSGEPDDCDISIRSRSTSYVCHLVFPRELVESWGHSPVYPVRGAKSDKSDTSKLPWGRRWDRHKLLFAINFIQEYTRLFRRFPGNNEEFVFSAGPNSEELSNPFHRERYIQTYLGELRERQQAARKAES